MLELTIEQISMGQSAVDKSAALHLLAQHLVADGLVAEGISPACKPRKPRARLFSVKVLPSPTVPRIPATRCFPPACA